MKAVVTILIGAILTCASGAKETRAESASPQARPRLDPNSQLAVAATSTPTTAAESPVLVMSPFIVRDTAHARPAPPAGATPQGAPTLSGSRFLDALQTGIMLQHTGKKFTSEFLAHGESDAGGFGRLKIGYSLSW